MYVSFGLCTDQTTVLYQDSRLPLRSVAAAHSLAGRPDSYMSSFLSKCAMSGQGADGFRHETGLTGKSVRPPIHWLALVIIAAVHTAVTSGKLPVFIKTAPNFQNMSAITLIFNGLPRNPPKIMLYALKSISP